jgi:hypothetical protein
VENAYGKDTIPVPIMVLHRSTVEERTLVRLFLWVLNKPGERKSLLYREEVLIVIDGELLEAVSTSNLAVCSSLSIDILGSEPVWRAGRSEPRRVILSSLICNLLAREEERFSFFEFEEGGS